MSSSFICFVTLRTERKRRERGEGQRRKECRKERKRESRVGKGETWGCERKGKETRTRAEYENGREKVRRKEGGSSEEEREAREGRGDS